MPDLVDELASTVALRLRKLGLAEPRRSVVASLLRMAYLASFKTEEGRFVRGSLTYANPKNPDENPPLMKRADYPGFARFGDPEVLTVDTLVKLARAIDRWPGSLAIHARRDELVAWGVVDQLVGESVRIHRESDRGFTNPGLLTVTMDGLGEVSAYHGDMFLGSIRSQILVTREDDAFQSRMVLEYAMAAVLPFSFAITHVLGNTHRDKYIPLTLMRRWSATVARLCIGLRRLGTGGAFLLTPKPLMGQLRVHHAFSYRRLEQAFALTVFDQLYASQMLDQLSDARSKGSVSSERLPVDRDMRARGFSMIPWLKARSQRGDGGDHMSLVKKLVRLGDSTGVILDPEILRQVDVEPDSEVEISVEDSAIVIRPSRYASDDDTRAAGRNVIRNRRRLLERLSK